MSTMINFNNFRLRELFRQKHDESPQRYESVPPEAQEGLLNSPEELRDASVQDTTNVRCPSRWRFTAPLMWMLGCLVLTFGIYIYSSAAYCVAGPSLVYCTLQTRKLSRQSQHQLQ